MRFEEKLRKFSKSQLWQEYCGFLDMDMERYMYTQRRLMEEQIRVWCDCPLGKRLLDGKKPENINQFLDMLPMTRYQDYSEDLLSRHEGVLCAKPAIWIETTWEGGLHPIKAAPYSRGMLDVYRHNQIASVMMATAKKKGEVNIQVGDRVLYGGAPLPYASGLMPTLFDEDIHFEWLPDTNAKSNLSFSERIKKGFNMAFSGGMDYFFGLGSVTNYITEQFCRSAGKGSVSDSDEEERTFAAAFRYIKGKYRAHQESRGMLPKDAFTLKALFCAGTDSACYKERLEQAWGIIPVEIAAGTESTCIGCENWEHNGMVFFPDSCFYEFIPEEEMFRNMEDPSYIPRTCLMDQVQAGETYELVISVLHGGAFMRYRIGDLYRCLSAGNRQLPRFVFMDRTPDVIDIAGFTRITEASVREVIRLSHMPISNWVMKKEFDGKQNPFLHMYAEIDPDAQINRATTVSVIKDCLSAYFKYFDSDYSDLKKLLDIEPLDVTVLRFGTIQAYEKRLGKKLRKINPGQLDIAGLLKTHEEPVERNWN